MKSWIINKIKLRYEYLSFFVFVSCIWICDDCGGWQSLCKLYSLANSLVCKFANSQFAKSVPPVSIVAIRKIRAADYIYLYLSSAFFTIFLTWSLFALMILPKPRLSGGIRRIGFGSPCSELCPQKFAIASV